MYKNELNGSFFLIFGLELSCNSIKLLKAIRLSLVTEKGKFSITTR